MALDQTVNSLRLQLRLVAVLVLAHIAYAGARLTVMLHALHLGASQFQVGLILSLMMLVPALTSLRIGRWTDRVGFARPTLLGISLVVLGNLCAGSLPKLWVFMPVAVFLGSGQMLLQVAIMHVTGRMAPSGPGAAQGFSRVGLGYAVSGLLGPVLAGFLIDRVGYQPTFFLLCVPTVLALGMFHLSARAVAVTERLATGDHAGSVRSCASVWKHPPLRAALFITALLTLAWDFFNFAMPLHTVQMGFSASEIGSIAGSMSMGMFTIRLFLAFIVRHASERSIVFTVLLLTAACFLVFPFAATLGEYLALSYVLGMVIGSGQPLMMSMVHSHAPAGRTGEAAGARTMIVSVSQMVFPLAFGALGATLGVVPAFWGIALLFVVSLFTQARRL